MVVSVATVVVVTLISPCSVGLLSKFSVGKFRLETVWNVLSLVGTCVVASSFNFVVTSETVLVTSPVLIVVNLTPSSLVLLSKVVMVDSVLDSTICVWEAELSCCLSVVVVCFVKRVSGILLTLLWILSSVCGWTKLELSIELSSMLLPMIWGRIVLSPIWQQEPK